MSANLQSIVALIIVGLVAVLLARSHFKKRNSTGCGGSCGCPTDQFKKQLKSAE